MYFVKLIKPVKIIRVSILAPHGYYFRDAGHLCERLAHGHCPAV